MARRRDLFALPALLALPAGAAKLPNTALNASALKVEKAGYGEARVYFDGSTDQLKAMTAGSVKLKPGAAPHPPHAHKEEEFLLIAEGAGEIEINGKKAPVQAGAMLYCAANVPHGILNTGKTPLLFYYYKWLA
jgi:mannose-6-phosphate isomerase-like protein (cupin superfamily)